MKKTEGTQKT